MQERRVPKPINWVIGVFDEKPNYPIIPISSTQLTGNWVFEKILEIGSQTDAIKVKIMKFI
jgi:hypothetical protein